jgi:Ca2+-binding RTX toxin-like protein
MQSMWRRGLVAPALKALLMAGMLLAVLPAAAMAANVNVVKVATPVSLGEPGGTFLFSVNISSDYPGPPGNLKITGITDDIYGDVTQIPGSNCSTIINTPIRAGLDSRSCSFPGTFTGVAGDRQTDTVTVFAECVPKGACGVQTGSAQATVEITCPGCPPGFDLTTTGLGSNIDCKGRPPTIVGTGLGETIHGTPGRDIVQAGPGRDTIKGLEGNDRLCGAKDKDTIRGGRGNDFMNGGSAKDICIGGPGKDNIRGNTCSVVRSVP